jgi:hypothetical protein
MGVSRINVTIDQVVFRGLEPSERTALLEGLRGELSRILGDAAGRAEWAKSHRTPVLKLGRMPLEPGTAGGRKFGGGLARAIGKGLKP